MANEDQHSSSSAGAAPAVPTLIVNDILDAGQLSHPETLRGRALAVARGTISDAQLVEWFLEERAPSENTRKSYEAQLRRLVWFATKALGAASVRHLQREDWKGFDSYLTTPPADHVMEASVGLDHEDWRPFRGPLRGSSVAQAKTVIKSFYAWMAEPEIGAIARNPFGSLKTRRKRTAKSASTIERFVDDGAWLFIERALAAMPASTELEVRAHARAEWVFELLVFSGLRASEIAAARSSMIRPAPHGGWHLEITRKGDVDSKLKLPDRVLHAWAKYRQACGINAGAPGSRGPDLPLVSGIRGEHMDQPMTRQSIWQLIKSVCACAADLAMESGSEHAEHAAAQLRACSPHWMRHTFAARLMKSGASVVTVQDLMDHASVSTTSGYLHSADAEKRSALEKMAAAAPG